ncbi:hypothetical protein GIW32_19115 [Pseudomonas syringae]|nr:hypothetical protein [Pseudomonas syringae]MCF5240864.1 hypothetical protein [Pseudomonas syringae]PYD06767.1 hypothetical protein DND90_18745 [Pseudomonas syringae pv. maculicola]TES60133.1 hypothetical protein E2N91_06950 [Pseudomonas syringae pv. tomato]TES75942.1 hypothetical protein E2N89_19390 [Pseudomonas syringae pv. tomato]
MGDALRYRSVPRRTFRS